MLEQLKSIADPSEVLTNEPMKDHTTFKVGGGADIFVTAKTIEEATDIVRLLLANNVRFTVIGNGSNLLVSDKGYRGCIVCMGADTIRADGTRIKASAGAMLSKVAKTAYDNSLTGLEFASGIPGSVGGAVVMNAGAYGSEMKNVISSVTLFDTATLLPVTLSCDEMDVGYRTSVVKKHPYIVLEAEFELECGDRKLIKEKTDELAAARRSKQPLEYPSAGSTFKRPEGNFAGKLIEEAGLRGYQKGGAAVSDKHCGFVINKGNAAATDVIGLIRDVRQKVFEQSGVMLEPEVVMLGEDMDI